ncbi:hypothetical protein DL93DRAFT_2087751 [Clavulina sp. PMI_390]|nr:hypothetical protein DL93DRAFT_2087751 [Clavulina sp. PMI_390]
MTDTPTVREYISFPNGDILLRSSDGVQFQLDSLILGRASPLFATMLQLPPSNHPSADPIDLTETADVLDDLFRAIYPQSPIPNTSSHEHVFALLRAFDKYEITKGAYLDALSNYWGTLPNPIEAWVCAVRLNNSQLRRNAVRAYLAQPEMLPERTMDLRFIDAAAFLHLIYIKKQASAIGRRLMGRWANICFCTHHDTSAPYVVDVLANPLRSESMTDESLAVGTASCKHCRALSTLLDGHPQRERYRDALDALLDAAVTAEQNNSPLETPEATTEVLADHPIRGVD